jgi:uncharacterized protein involved in outer membrane biogenesis
MTGRPLAIGGELDVDFGSVTRISVTDVSLANEPWASSDTLLHVDRVQVDLALRPLLRGRLSLPRIELHRPALFLERDARGVPNWRLASRLPPRRLVAPLGTREIGELVIREGTLRLVDQHWRCNLELEIETIARGADDEYSPLVAVGAGRCRDFPFGVSGRVDAPSQLLLEGGEPRIDFSARAGETIARLHGRVATPLDADRFELEAEFAGADLADLHTLFLLAMPESPPYLLRGRLGRDGPLLRFREFAGSIGDSEVRGDLSVQTDGERPFVRTSIVARHLDFDDLGVLVGAPPGTGPGETANARQKAAAQARDAGSRWLPSRPYDLTVLRSADADARFVATDVRSRRLPIDSLDAELELRGGVASVRLVELGVANGDVRGSVVLDARRDPIAMTADLRASGVELPRLLPRIRDTSVGRIGGTARIEGRGNSIAQMLATADGEVSTVMGSGKVSNLVLEVAGLDVAESLKFLIGPDRAIGLRCAYADFRLTDGVARSRSLAFDTTDTVILGKGSIDLDHERFDLVLRPRPKDVSPVSLRGPLEIGGTFKDPSVRPQAGPLAARVAAAAALFAVTPPAALLALIETGPGEDVDCERPASAKNKGAQVELQRLEEGAG